MPLGHTCQWLLEAAAVRLAGLRWGQSLGQGAGGGQEKATGLSTA